MSSPIECPICMEGIEGTLNIVTTECGHVFHCRCLMQNAAHNGFGCPYCRAIMAETPEEEDSDDDEGSFIDDEDEQDEQENYILQGFRMFFNNVEGIPHEEDDVEEENHPKPTAAFVTQELLSQGVTMEQLVSVLLLDHDEYDEEEEAFERIDEDVWGKMRTIISNYQPQQELEPLEQPLVAEAKETAPAPRRREMILHI